MWVFLTLKTSSKRIAVIKQTINVNKFRHVLRKLTPTHIICTFKTIWSLTNGKSQIVLCCNQKFEFQFPMGIIFEIRFLKITTFIFIKCLLQEKKTLVFITFEPKQGDVVMHRKKPEMKKKSKKNIRKSYYKLTTIL